MKFRKIKMIGSNSVCCEWDGNYRLLSDNVGAWQSYLSCESSERGWIDRLTLYVSERRLG